MRITRNNMCYCLIQALLLTIFSLAILVSGCVGGEVEPNNFSLTLVTLTYGDLDDARRLSDDGFYV